MHVLLATLLIVIIGVISSTFASDYIDSYFKKNGYNNPLTNQKLLIAFLFASFSGIFLACSYGDYGSVFASVFLSIAILTSITDVAIYKIPNVLSFIGFATACISLVTYSLVHFSYSYFMNFLLLFLFLSICALIVILLKLELGVGDIKLYFGYLLWIGSYQQIYALYAYALSLFLIIIYVLARNKDIKAPIPCAPFISAGTLIIWILFASSRTPLLEIVFQ